MMTGIEIQGVVGSSIKTRSPTRSVLRSPRVFQGSTEQHRDKPCFGRYQQVHRSGHATLQWNLTWTGPGSFAGEGPGAGEEAAPLASRAPGRYFHGVGIGWKTLHKPAQEAGSQSPGWRGKRETAPGATSQTSREPPAQREEGAGQPL